MSDITLSAGVRQNLLSLQQTADLMSQTQNRLATGKEVNSALDNPTNFFTSSSLQTRASDLSSLLDSMSNGIKTLEAADNGLSAITNNLESMQSTLRQARQDKSFKTTSYEVDTGSSPTGSEQLSFSGGAVGSTAVDIDLVNAGTSTQSTVTASADYTAPTAATSGVNSQTYTASAVAYGATDTSTISINVDGAGAETLTINQAAVQAVGDNDSTVDTIDELTDVLNNLIGANGNLSGNVVASNDGTNITFTSQSTGSGSSVAITAAVGDADGANAANTTFGIGVNSGTDGDAAVDRAITISDGTNTASITLTSANAGDASTARTYIQSQLTANNVNATVGGSGNRIDLAGAADGSNSLTVGGANANDVFGSSATTVAGVAGEAAAAKTVDALVAEINSHSSLDGKIRASNDNGKLRIENQSTQDLDIGGVSSSGTVDGSSSTTKIEGNDVRGDLATQFNELKDQLDKLSDDASFNGINLLRGDNLQITFNETGTSTLEIQTKEGAAVNAAALKLETIDAAKLDADSDIDALIGQVGDALNSIRSQSSAFGSNLSMVENRQDFTQSMINTLQTGADNLVLADTNEEAANMLALQTRQQLSSTALSLASQQDQAVLRLF